MYDNTLVILGILFATNTLTALLAFGGMHLFQLSKETTNERAQLIAEMRKMVDRINKLEQICAALMNKEQK